MTVIHTRWFGASVQVLRDVDTGKWWFVLLTWRYPGFITRTWCYRLPEAVQRVFG